MTTFNHSESLDPDRPLPEPTEVGHEHPDVTGGWLRPAVFGAMDGMVSNFALVMGVTGGSDDTEPVIIAGLAGLVARQVGMECHGSKVAASDEFFTEGMARLSRRLDATKYAAASANTMIDVQTLRRNGPMSLTVSMRSISIQTRPAV